jgi:SAM-dependent methyltransferase
MADLEHERVRAAYERRDGRGATYDWRRLDVIARKAAASRAFGRTLLAHEMQPLSVLEVGCGTGGPLSEFLPSGASRLLGLDLQEDRLQVAGRTHPRLLIALADARLIPTPAHTFDCVISSTIFSSVLDDHVSTAIAREVDRVLAPGGCVLWFDMRFGNPANRDVRAVPRRAIRSLFPGYELDLHPCVLAPPVARRTLSRPLVAALAEQIRALRSHLGGGLWKPAEGG